MLGFLVALVVVSELTVLAHFTGDRFSGNEDSAEVASLTGLPILAKVPRGEGIEVVEAYRVLRTNLMVLEGAGKPRTVAIVSANQAAGKTFTAVHLADSASALEEKVVLDRRRPPQAHRARARSACPGRPGLSSVLQGGDLTTALTKVPDNAYLRVLPSGAPVLDASGVLGARSFRHVLDALRAVRLVIVDTPPTNLFADALAVASQCDATIFVLDVKTSRRRAVRQALEALDRAGANLIGVVINRARCRRPPRTTRAECPHVSLRLAGAEVAPVEVVGDGRGEVVGRLPRERPETARTVRAAGRARDRGRATARIARPTGHGTGRTSPTPRARSPRPAPRVFTVGGPRERAEARDAGHAGAERDEHQHLGHDRRPRPSPCSRARGSGSG